MLQDEAAQLLQMARAELVKAAKQLAEVQSRVDNLNKVIDGIIGLFPKLNDANTSKSSSKVGVFRDRIGHPVGREAVGTVLREHPLTDFTVVAMTGALDQRGWTPRSDDPAAAVRTSLERVAKTDPDVHKSRTPTGTVVFSYRPRALNGAVLPPPSQAQLEEVDSS